MGQLKDPWMFPSSSEDMLVSTDIHVELSRGILENCGRWKRSQVVPPMINQVLTGICLPSFFPSCELVCIVILKRSNTLLPILLISAIGSSATKGSLYDNDNGVGYMYTHKSTCTLHLCSDNDPHLQTFLCRPYLFPSIIVERGIGKASTWIMDKHKISLVLDQ